MAFNLKVKRKFFNWLKNLPFPIHRFFWGQPLQGHIIIRKSISDSFNLTFRIRTEEIRVQLVYHFLVHNRFKLPGKICRLILINLKCTDHVL